LLDQAVAAFQNALEVRTRADLPQDWAKVENNLGNALRDEGERNTGDKATALLNQAVQAYNSALEIFTRDGLPQYWAVVMGNLARAHRDLGDTASADAESKAANEVDPQ
jgi:tetratricopeptide (TPR) repeat protein